MPQISCTGWCEIQSFNSVCKFQYPLHKNRRRKVERVVNLKMADEIKAGRINQS